MTTASVTNDLRQANSVKTVITPSNESPRSWSVADLGSFYTSHRSELHAHASRILKDSTRADEVVQDALIKFMLAAPEINSEEHAIAYLHRTIENLCIDLFRIEGRRPNLVVLDDAQAEVEATWQDKGDFSAELIAADDAAIVRQALALLSPAERTALVMWEMEGRTTEEIASTLNIKESAVRHTVSRARTSLRRILSEMIIDEERGLTALDLLSTSYKKAAELAKKSSKAALSLLILLVAFLGFNSVTGHEVSTTNTITTAAGTTPSDVTPSVAAATPSLSSSSSSTPSAAATAAQLAAKKAASQAQTVDAKIPTLSFAGLNHDGVPTGFTATDNAGHTGRIIVGHPDPILTADGLTLHTNAMSYDANAINVLLDQTFVVNGSGTTYSVAASVSINHSWNPLLLSSTSTDFVRQDDGTYLVTATMAVDSLLDSGLIIPTQKGVDVTAAPTQIITRILLNPTKSQILAQAIEVTTKGAK